MRGRGATLIGAHDFSAFRASECQARSPVRTLRARDRARSGDCSCFEFAANAFLHHMVRNIVGCLVYVGKRQDAAGGLAELLDGRDRKQARRRLTLRACIWCGQLRRAGTAASDAQSMV